MTKVVEAADVATTSAAEVHASPRARRGARATSVLGGFLARRFAMMVATIGVASFAIYASTRLIPGDPVAVLTKGKIQDPDQIAALKAEYRLDEPLFSGYVNWVGHALSGDFGKSVVYKQPVADLVQSRVGLTACLVLFAMVLIMVFGLALGAVGALRQGWVSSAVTVLTTLMVAIPGFVASALLILLFSVTVPLFPAYGAGEPGVDRLYHLVLPAIALSLSSTALIARVTRVSMAEELHKEHVETARSRGLSGAQVVRRHVVRNALVPITTSAGVTFAYLVVGAVVVESAFSLSGIGTLLTQAVLARDFALVQFIVLLMIVTFIAVNTLVDILYSTIDPRIRMRSGEA